MTEVVGKVQPTMSPITITGSVASSCAPNYCFPYGTTFTFSTTMNPAGPAPPYTAQVAFTDNGTPIGLATINATTGVASISNILLPGGTDHVTATLPRTANYNNDPVTSTIVISTLPMVPGSTETLSPSTAITVTYGGSLPASGSLTVTFLPGCGVCAIPSGTVNVFAGPTSLLLGTFTILASGSRVRPISVPVLLRGTFGGHGANPDLRLLGRRQLRAPVAAALGCPAGG